MVLGHMSGMHGLMARLLYGTGMRLMECLRLRVKDVDFPRGHIVVREGKGAKDRVTVLPEKPTPELHAAFAASQAVHRTAIWRNGFGRVYLPDALARKYPRADREWAWQWIFPARRPLQGSAQRQRCAGTTPGRWRCSGP